MDHLELHPAVRETGQEVSGHPCLLPPLLPSSMEVLERLAVQEVLEGVEVEVVLAAGAGRERPRQAVVARLLQGLALTGGCWVQCSALARERYGVVGVRVSGVEGVVRMAPGGVVRIRSVTGQKRLQLLEEGRHAPALGGVERETSSLRAAMGAGEGCLVAGARGSGKTALVLRVASDLELPVVRASCASLGRPEPGGTEAELRSVWEAAREVGREGGAVLLLEEVECLAGPRVTAQLQAQLECRGDGVLLAATTTTPELLQPALRRPGRLGREVSLPTPGQDQRLAMLRCLAPADLLQEMLPGLAAATPGFLAADLALLVARLAALGPALSQDQVEEELVRTRPAALRSGLGSVTLEPVAWESLGGLERVKALLERAVSLPLARPDAFLRWEQLAKLRHPPCCRLGVRLSRGVLLWGPPGCGKTRLVRAAASHCRATFLSVSAAEIYSPYVGDR